MREPIRRRHVEAADEAQIAQWEEEAVAALTDDGDMEAALNAAESLVALGRRRDLLLAKAQRPTHDRLRSAALSALARLGGEACDELVNQVLPDALSSPNAYVACAALDVVRRLRLNLFVREARDLFDHDDSEYVRGDALRALASIGHPSEDLDRVRSALRSSTWKVRQAGLIASATFADKRLGGELASLVEEEPTLLAKPSSAKALCRALRKCSADPAQVGPVLADMLETAGLRTIALSALAAPHMAYQPAHPAIRRILEHDPKDATRAAAAETLAWWGALKDDEWAFLLGTEADVVAQRLLHVASELRHVDVAAAVADVALRRPGSLRELALRVHVDLTGELSLARRLAHDHLPSVADAARELLDEHDEPYPQHAATPVRYRVRIWKLVEEHEEDLPPVPAAAAEQVADRAMSTFDPEDTLRVEVLPAGSDGTVRAARVTTAARDSNGAPPTSGPDARHKPTL